MHRASEDKCDGQSSRALSHETNVFAEERFARRPRQKRATPEDVHHAEVVPFLSSSRCTKEMAIRGRSPGANQTSPLIVAVRPGATERVLHIHQLREHLQPPRETWPLTPVRSELGR